MISGPHYRLSRRMTPVEVPSRTVAPNELEGQLEGYRSELIGYCYRMVGSPFEAVEASGVSSKDPVPEMDEARKQLLARYVQAFERYDLSALTALIQEDAKQSMPPYDLWLQGRENILTWWFGPGIGCRGSRLLPTTGANGSVAFGQYKPSESGPGRDPWALLVVETAQDRIVEFTFFLDTAKLFPLFGLPDHID